MIVVDGKDAIVGRLATFVAKELLRGNWVTVVNAEKTIITGRRESIFEEWDTWMNTRNLANPRKGPFHHRYPEDILRRTIRGMLPYHKAKGKAAYKRLRVYRGVPEELEGKEMVKVQGADVGRLKTGRYIRLEELSKHLGAKL
ncbi:MAG: 50S ribosomal protein L13 [Candidatus Hadarchaeales archaeon]